jgi:predicted NBD/HSP70 family sugar kinase
VVELVRAGNQPATQAVRQAGREIGAVLAGCVSLLNPSVIVIGGSLSQAGDSLLAGIREAIYARSLPLATTELEVVVARSGRDAAVRGAATMVLHHVLDPGASTPGISTPGALDPGPEPVSPSVRTWPNGRSG